jgi:hypothetical protein
MAQPDPGLALTLGQGILAAYAAYDNNTDPIAPPGYTLGEQIYVWESASGGSLRFGFTATANDGSNNIVVLRGTRTATESSYDLYQWGTNTACVLPYGGQNSYGNVNQSLYDFYTGNNWTAVTSLADSLKAAVQKLGNTSIPWYVAAHSLGGAMATLGALDAYVSGSYSGGPPPILYTFGSLYVGDQSFADAFSGQVPVAYRFANLCDFVPIITGLTDDTTADPYVHVGLPCTFVWQNGRIWANHSMENVYLATVEKSWNVIQYGPLNYPASVQQ